MRLEAGRTHAAPDPLGPPVLSVRGLTTAASIWVTSAIGILVGAGLGIYMTYARFNKADRQENG